MRLFIVFKVKFIICFDSFQLCIIVKFDSPLDLFCNFISDACHGMLASVMKINWIEIMVSSGKESKESV